jgi:hypothetical protein
MTTAPPAPPSHRMPMRPARRWILGVGAVLSLAAIGYGLLMVINLLGRTSEERTATLPTTGQRLVVDSSGGSIRVTGGDVPDVRITTKLTYGLAEPKLVQEAGPDGIRLDSSCAWWSFICSTSYEVVVPPGFEVRAASSGGSIAIADLAGRLEASSSGGSIAMSDTTGPIRATSSGGGIRVAGARGPLDLRSSGGSITGDALRAAEVRARSSGGSVRLTFAAAPDLVSADSSGGSVQLLLPPVAGGYRVDAVSTGGSRTVAVPTDPASTHRIDARSSGGPVRVLPIPDG